MWLTPAARSRSRIWSAFSCRMAPRAAAPKMTRVLRCPVRPNGSVSTRPSSTAPGVELLGDALVVRLERFGVDVGEAEDPHVGVRAADLGPPEPDLLDGRHDAAEQRRPELAHHLGLARPRHALLRRQTERVPHLLAEEAVAHQIA